MRQTTVSRFALPLSFPEVMQWHVFPPATGRWDIVHSEDESTTVLLYRKQQPPLQSAILCRAVSFLQEAALPLGGKICGLFQPSRSLLFPFRLICFAFVLFLLTSLYCHFSFLPIANPGVVWPYPQDFLIRDIILSSREFQKISTVLCTVCQTVADEYSALSISFEMNMQKQRNACLWGVNSNFYLRCFTCSMNFTLMKFSLSFVLYLCSSVQAISAWSTCSLFSWIFWMLCLNVCTVPR